MAEGFLRDILGYHDVAIEDGDKLPRRHFMRFLGQVVAVDNPVLGSTDVTIVTTSAFLENCRLATQANMGLSGLADVDSVTPIEDDRILVKSQTDPLENGTYLAKPAAWVRTLDMDATGDVLSGIRVAVLEGSVSGGDAFELATADPVQINISDIVWINAGSDAAELRGVNLDAATVGSASTGEGIFHDGADFKAALLKNVNVSPSAAIDVNKLANQEIEGTDNFWGSSGAGNPGSRDGGAADNTGFGNGVLAAITTGDRNTGLGDLALLLLTTGSGNTAVGRRTGQTVVTGSNNILIGDDAELWSGDPSNGMSIANAFRGHFIDPAKPVLRIGGAAALTLTGGSEALQMWGGIEFLRDAPADLAITFKQQNMGAAARSLSISAQGHTAQVGGNLSLRAGAGTSGGNFDLEQANGTRQFRINDVGIAFFDGTPTGKPTITGSRAGNAALASILTQLDSLGLINDTTSA